MDQTPDETLPKTPPEKAQSKPAQADQVPSSKEAHPRDKYPPSKSPKEVWPKPAEMDQVLSKEGLDKWPNDIPPKALPNGARSPEGSSIKRGLANKDTNADEPDPGESPTKKSPEGALSN
jgi:hypothetical protein